MAQSDFLINTAPQVPTQARRQKTILLMRSAGIALAVTVINASLVSFVNAGLHTPASAALLWWGLIVAVSTARCLLARTFFRTDRDAADSIRWQHRYVGATAAVAAAWGAGAVLFMWDAPDSARLFTGLILCGMVAGAVPLLGAVPAAYRTYSLLVGVPTSAIVLLQADSALLWAFGTASIVFVAAMLASAHHLHRSLDASIRLGLEKARLLDNLERARRAAEAAVEASNLSIWEFDVGAGQAYLDENWPKIVGGDPGQRVDSLHDLLQTVHPDDRGRIEACATRVAEGALPGFREDFRVRDARGQWKWITCRGKIVEHSTDGRPVRAIGTTIDISARKATEAALAASEQRYRALFDDAPVGIALTTLDGAVVDANETMFRLFGHSPEDRAQLLGRIDIRRLYADASTRDEWLQIVRRSGAVHGYEAQFRRKDGSTFFGSLTVDQVEQEGVAHLLVILEDVTQQRLWRERMVHQANYDALTDLPNRRLMLDRARQAVDDARRLKRRAAVLFLDLDRFKRVNDSFGHDVGDQLLKEVAVRLKAVVRRGDTVCRLGGDEFVVVLTDLEQPDDASMVAHKILEVLRAPIGTGQNPLVTTASIGIGVYPDDSAGDAEQLVRKADEAMYAAKQEGGNRFSKYAPSCECT